MRFQALGAAAIALVFNVAARAADPLPSWNDGESKRAIIAFVEKVTTAGSPGYVPAAERIAVFDNDGTLWAEQPMYFQLLFALDRVKALAPQHPEWKDKEPFASLLKGDVKKALAGGDKAILEIRDGCLNVVNLGDDADTTGAVFGQLAGAYYGEHGIPPAWRGRLHAQDLIASLADRLHQQRR